MRWMGSMVELTGVTDAMGVVGVTDAMGVGLECLLLRTLLPSGRWHAHSGCPGRLTKRIAVAKCYSGFELLRCQATCVSSVPGAPA